MNRASCTRSPCQSPWPATSTGPPREASFSVRSRLANVAVLPLRSSRNSSVPSSTKIGTGSLGGEARSSLGARPSGMLQFARPCASTVRLSRGRTSLTCATSARRWNKAATFILSLSWSASAKASSPPAGGLASRIPLKVTATSGHKESLGACDMTSVRPVAAATERSTSAAR